MNKPIQIAIIVLCIGGAGYLLYGFFSKPGPTANEGIPEYLHYKCANRSCGHEYTWQRGTEIADGGSVDTCPKCGTIEALRSAKCQECGLFQPLQGHGSFEKTCPGCGASLPTLREQK